MKKVSLSIDESLWNQAAELAEIKGVKNGSNSGVSTVIRMALKAYINKHPKLKTGAEQVFSDKATECTRI